MTSEPVNLFQEWFDLARERETFDATATTLATSGADNQPSARIVLLKHVDDRGFVIYTNRNSRKGNDLSHNPKAALCFFWPAIERQVRVEGSVEHVSEEESDAYFGSRPRGSQLGAWASQQSQPLSSRPDLVKDYLQLKLKYTGRTIPRPPHWGGYRIIPLRIEFWMLGHFRLHDRFEYRLTDGVWVRQQLYP